MSKRPKEDIVYLDHILYYAKIAIEYAGEDRNSEKTWLAILKCLENVGEATSNLSDECRQMDKELPWQKIKDFRNRLSHGYYDISANSVWDIVDDNLPELIDRVHNIRLRIINK